MKLFEIQRKLKYEFNFKLVPIQSGYYFNLFNEDADFFQVNFNFKTYEQGIHKLAGFPITRLRHYKERFDKMNIPYAFVEQGLTNEDNSITRIVTYTSDSNAINKTFNKRFVQKKEDKLKEYLSALINGFNPFNGIYFKEDSVWKHPEILSILKKICQNNTDFEFSGKPERVQYGLTTPRVKVKTQQRYIDIFKELLTNEGIISQKGLSKFKDTEIKQYLLDIKSLSKIELRHYKVDQTVWSNLIQKLNIYLGRDVYKIYKGLNKKVYPTFFEDCTLERNTIFKIEEMHSMNIYSKGLIINERTIRSFETTRHSNFGKNKPLNFSLPYSLEETKILEILVKRRIKQSDLILFFQRDLSNILWILEKNTSYKTIDGNKELFRNS